MSKEDETTEEETTPSQSELNGVLSALAENLINIGDRTSQDGDQKKRLGDIDGARTMYTVSGILGLLGQAIEDSLSI